MPIRPVISLYIVLVWLFTVVPAGAGEPSRLLDGMTFVGSNGEKGREAESDEEEALIFEDGLFTSSSCVPYNFSSSQYSARVTGDQIHFEAITTSPTHGQIAWKGTIEGKSADVIFIWTKERWFWNTRREYWFKGVLKE
ncbi:hypothetical protein [Motiliproteus coralliicola]|nr:hypothetical protein [Motiliproteus coralliicola]